MLEIPDAGVLQDKQPAPEGDEKVTKPMPDDDAILRKKTLKLGEVDEDDEVPRGSGDDKVGIFIHGLLC